MQKEQKYYSIAIDGPAGAGKSTIAKLVAKELQFIYVDTGAMYRAIGLLAVKEGVDMKEEETLGALARKADINLKYENGRQQIYLNGENVTDDIRTEEAGKMASAVGKVKAVREKMVDLQKKIAESDHVIMDGRDIGTVVLPLADLKVYLTADARVRAERRFKELTEKGISCNIEEIEKDIVARDYQDMNREASPLKQAEDAVALDCSYMTIEEVAASIINLFRKAVS
ncbi:cytidylate kinase [Anaerocolumna jejuensis DSM 15929]|uniref:Cytidylate kinase n=1 Tax=Anaerocolumna jejuensis DSM 15929 TaxID=1121322 RepID=A0A1M6K3Z6_9FIRM|nr:(d)CMP kinase [Anaerocolumna jejuensis]SHJ53713.1 cytidylate kinase [Anaerocolumna jejuensis DSM 15929]